MTAALAYAEPSIGTILVLTSFLLLLNVLNWALDAALSCGLVGQIAVGVAWGTPGGQLLSVSAERFVVQLGYLGLILLVYEGGLSTSFTALRANIALSAAVAATGTAVPIGLSFALPSLVLGTTASAAFAAGAALCSTSLGTAFVVLRTSGLAATRLGVVLAGAAMLDDVFGLVMVQVIAGLSDSVTAATVVRPVLVSVGLAVAGVLACWAVGCWRTACPRIVGREHAVALVLHTGLLVGAVTAASYAGTSNLFAAYGAGAMASWWEEGATSSPRALGIYDDYYRPAAQRILQPFFFASIGFAIPVRKMFAGHVLWKGVVYAVLMCVGKLVCGLWLVRSGEAREERGAEMEMEGVQRGRATGGDTATEGTETAVTADTADTADGNTADTAGGIETINTTEETETAQTTDTTDRPGTGGDRSDVTGNRSGATGNTTGGRDEAGPERRTPTSLYPAALLGVAMVPRGEIGFLIAAIAQSQGVLGDDGGSEELFLVVTWAIVLCTLLAPPCVGLLVRRVRRLEAEKGGEDESARDVLGVWK